MVKIVESAKGSLNKCDWKQWLLNLRDYFLFPVIIIYLTEVSYRISTKGLSVECFIPDILMLGLIIMGLINALINILKKYRQGE